ncbi:MAG TPA: alkaline phosphatase family protein [Methylomirabilota bacterium]|nr:alkaline phosphatase family protein [Methylomirabilota bacterium]
MVAIAGIAIVLALQSVMGGAPPGGSPSPSSSLVAAVSSESVGPAESSTGEPAGTSSATPGSSVDSSPSAVASPTATAKATSAPTAKPTPKPTTKPTPKPTPAPPAAGAWPKIGHIYEIVLENKEIGSVIGDSSAPYINSLANKYGLATNYTAVSHPSLPNYLALWSGSTQGVKDDGTYNFTKGRTLADQIEASGRSWHVAAENVPLGCFTGSSASDGPDGPGKYARKHEPAISWTSVSTNPSRCDNITDFTHFRPSVGNFWFIVPNLCHDMHDCSVAIGDAWLKGFLPGILNSAAYKSNGLIVLTFDEGSSKAGGGGKVATILISPKAKTGFTSNRAHTHYSLVRTIEQLWGMPCMANSCSANTLREFFP